MLTVLRALALAAFFTAFLPLAFSASAGSKSCKSNEFWYDEKKCCLPIGGPKTPVTPPRGSDCPPSGYYWEKKQGCCVPTHPVPTQNPPPQCQKGWEWYPSLRKCLPAPTPPSPSPPTPSHKPGGYRRSSSFKSRASSSCPIGLDECPAFGQSAGDIECIDTLAEIESCGGCMSLGQGEDCTAIQGAWNVGCVQGSCKVYTCTAGYRLAHDGKSCVTL